MTEIPFRPYIGRHWKISPSVSVDDVYDLSMPGGNTVLYLTASQAKTMGLFLEELQRRDWMDAQRNMREALGL